jgi:DNA-directed RNA polymerase subunit RPC12/RpoP
MVEFLCPNGHKIRCQSEQAGRAAKCPRCGVKFRIPDAQELQSPESVDSDASVSPPEFTDSGISGKKPGASDVVPAKEPQIEFLCPNGHRLHGPASLQGRPGECPDCSSRFRIPTYEDISAEEEAEQQISLGRADGRSDSDPGAPTFDGAPFALETHEEAPDAKEEEEESMPTTISGKGGAGQSLAGLFVKLWGARPKDACVELQLRNGQKIVVDQFVPTLSQQSHGVFGVKALDGTFTLMAVAWDAVVCVQVRGLSELPKSTLLADRPR